MIKAIIFDFDGVIVETANLRFKSLTEALKNHGYEVGYSSSNYFIGRTRKEFIDKFVGKITQKEVDKIIEESNRFYFRGIQNLKLIDGVKDLIEKLSKNFILAIASTSRRDFIEAVLSHFKLTNYFKTISSGDDVINKKPSPEVYLKTLKKLNLKNYECVAIEDATTGVESATSAGINCIVLKHENYSQDLSKADLIVNKIGDITMGTLMRLGE